MEYGGYLSKKKFSDLKPVKLKIVKYEQYFNLRKQLKENYCEKMNMFREFYRISWINNFLKNNDLKKK
jgi:hypothetical protein